jgi:transporter family protein
MSALFASLTALLSKIGIVGIESNLGTAIRTIIVLVMAWGIVFYTGAHMGIRDISKKSWIFIVLSGIVTGLSWLCYYRALQDGPISVVLPIDKLSTIVSIAFAYVVFKEKLTRKSAVGLALIVAGTLGMVIL